MRQVIIEVTTDEERNAVRSYLSSFKGQNVSYSVLNDEIVVDVSDERFLHLLYSRIRDFRKRLRMRGLFVYEV